MKLELENTDDLEWALRHQDDVTEIRISSVLLRRLGLNKLLDSIGFFKDLNKIRVADDYLRDKEEMENFQGTMETVFPYVEFSWTYDMRVDGKHGR